MMLNVLKFKMNRNVLNIILLYFFVSTFKVSEININGQKMGNLVVFEQLQFTLKNSIFVMYQIYKIRQELIGSIVLVKLGNVVNYDCLVESN